MCFGFTTNKKQKQQLERDGNQDRDQAQTMSNTTTPTNQAKAYSSSRPVVANFASEKIVTGAGVAIFHLASERVVVCYHSRDGYWFLPKGRRNEGEGSREAAVREGYEEVCRMFPSSSFSLAKVSTARCRCEDGRKNTKSLSQKPANTDLGVSILPVRLPLPTLAPPYSSPAATCRGRHQGRQVSQSVRDRARLDTAGSAIGDCSVHTALVHSRDTASGHEHSRRSIHRLFSANTVNASIRYASASRAYDHRGQSPDGRYRCAKREKRFRACPSRRDGSRRRRTFVRGVLASHR